MSRSIRAVACSPATARRAIVACAFAATAALPAAAQSLSVCVGAGCEIGGPAPPPAARCAAASTSPEDFHRIFARGCLAKRDFAAPAAACPADRPGCRTDRRGDFIESVVVYGAREDDEVVRPTLEQRFAGTLVQGNPEVPGGTIRHGAFYALGMYWGTDPLSFLYYNLRYGLFE